MKMSSTDDPQSARSIYSALVQDDSNSGLTVPGNRHVCVCVCVCVFTVEPLYYGHLGTKRTALIIGCPHFRGRRCIIAKYV